MNHSRVTHASLEHCKVLLERDNWGAVEGVAEMSTPEPTAASKQSITFPFGNQRREAYLARPEAEGPLPGLVIIHELYGLNDNIRDIAVRFAAQGYVALAVDLFAGHNRALCVLRLFGGMALRSLDNSALNELKAALSHLAKQPGVDPNRLGAVGFCMGGAFAIAW